MRKALGLLVLFLGTAGLSAGGPATGEDAREKPVPSGWKQVYAHTETGSADEGSLEQLREFIERGYAVMVVLAEPLDGGANLDTADGRWFTCDSVLLSSVADTVACVNGEALADLAANGTGGPNLDTAYYAILMASTEGRLHIIRRALSDDRNLAETKVRQGFAWYVRGD